jgi:guanosine-3',5'-bis(diphosphate) 3'-pyrophosphohydrolase
MGLIKDLSRFERAVDFARVKHNGQFRRSGEAYVEHCIRVARLIEKFKDSCDMDDLIIAGVLHDTLEDTDTGVSELRENFGEVVALLIVEVTTDKMARKVSGKDIYLSEKLSNGRMMSNWGLVVKLADRLDNVSDLGDRDLDWSRMFKRSTEIILDAIEGGRELSRTHMKLIGAIRERLGELEF